MAKKSPKKRTAHPRKKVVKAPVAEAPIAVEPPVPEVNEAPEVVEQSTPPQKTLYPTRGITGIGAHNGHPPNPLHVAGVVHTKGSVVYCARCRKQSTS